MRTLASSVVPQFACLESGRNRDDGRQLSAKAGVAWPLQKEVIRKDANMGVIGKAIDRLPPWAKLIFWGLTIIGSVYCIARYGFWSFLLRVIFSPNL